MTGGDTSSVGTAGVYEAKDQQAPEQPNTVNPRPEYHQERDAKQGTHRREDKKDERSIANRLAEETQAEDADKAVSEEAKLAQKDPLAPAMHNGNEPSKGAKIDAEIKAEEAEQLKKKGDFGPAAAN